MHAQHSVHATWNFTLHSCPQRKLQHNTCIFSKSCTNPPIVLDPLLVAAVAPTRAFQHSFTPQNHLYLPHSYIKDSSALLECTNVPQGALLVTICVSSLYTNIPQDEACLEATETVEVSYIPQSTLLEQFIIVLKCNAFSFDNSMYQWTAMGTRMASSRSA